VESHKHWTGRARVAGSILIAPTIHLSDGWKLNKNARGQKGADKTVGPVFLCELSAVRVTTGFAGLEVQEASPRTPYMEIGADLR
jgi:hypothetical protein